MNNVDTGKRFPFRWVELDDPDEEYYIDINVMRQLTGNDSMTGAQLSGLDLGPLIPEESHDENNPGFMDPFVDDDAIMPIDPAHNIPNHNVRFDPPFLGNGPPILLPMDEPET